ncbi:MAG: Holliday junction branch migration protein RuvA [Bacteroidota bacterium]|jgi:Holliday junction DNA helicase RuvA
MIAFVEGGFVHKAPGVTWVNVNGLGYEVNTSLHTYEKIQNLSQGRLLTYLKVSEDAHTLYGFYDQAEKNLFTHLISVNGVGAATARVMLSGMQPNEIANAIASGDVKLLERVKGIGAKTAQRIVLELREKIAKSDILGSEIASPENNLKTDAFNALVSLGIARNNAADAITKVLKNDPQITDVQELIKLALKAI